MATAVRTTAVPEALLPHLRRARDLADRRYAEPLDLDAAADSSSRRSRTQAPTSALTRER